MTLVVAPPPNPPISCWPGGYPGATYPGGYTTANEAANVYASTLPRPVYARPHHLYGPRY